MTFESVITILFVMFIYVLKPGPSILAMISRSLSDGFASGFTLALGNASAHLIYFLLAVFGYAIVEAHLEFATFILKSIGAVYVIYIGIKGLLNLEAGTWGGKKDQTYKISFAENYFSGLTICLSSPYTILFYIAIVPQMLPLGNLNAIDVIASTMLIVGTYLTLHTIISYFCATMRDTLKNDHLVRRVNFIVSIIFIGIGIFFLVTMFPIVEFTLNIF